MIPYSNIKGVSKVPRNHVHTGENCDYPLGYCNLVFLSVRECDPFYIYKSNKAVDIDLLLSLDIYIYIYIYIYIIEKLNKKPKHHSAMINLFQLVPL